jgi:hypothetical protein
MDHGNVNPMLAGTRQMVFTILGQRATFARSGKGAFNHPSLQRNHKTPLPTFSTHSLDLNAKDLLNPVNVGSTVIRQQSLPTVVQWLGPQHPGPVNFILLVRRMHFDPHQPALTIGGQVSYASFDAYVTIIAARTPFSTFCTDCTLPITRLGLASCPACWHTGLCMLSLFFLRHGTDLISGTHLIPSTPMENWAAIRAANRPCNAYKMVSGYSHILSGVYASLSVMALNASIVYHLSRATVFHCILFVICFFTNILLLVSFYTVRHTDHSSRASATGKCHIHTICFGGPKH